MFDIYQTLLSVSFNEKSNIPVWHESVRAFEVTNQGGDEPIAYFFMDLFPRKGKYQHAAAATFRSGWWDNESERYNIPASTILANFAPSSQNSPSLLQHSEVVTLFHEFGHIMHQVLTKSEFARFSGTRVYRDFVEAPSQMLENWVWERETLEKLSGHFQDEQRKLPTRLLDKLLKAKNAHQGLHYCRQLVFGKVDLKYHSTDFETDTIETWKQVQKDTLGIEVTEGGIPAAGFGHIMGGYEAGYYGYLWAEVFAADMFTRFTKEGLLNPKTGSEYRKWILEPGGSQEPKELLEGFLGRKPNENAFIQKISP